MELLSAMAAVKTTGLFFSGGADSLLLLNILLEIVPASTFAVMCFDHTFSAEQSKHIDEILERHDLRAFSYRPTTAYLMGDGKRISLVEEYALNGTLPMAFVKDVEHTEAAGRCAVTDIKLGPWHEGPAPLQFELHLFGTRRSDKHYSAKRAWDRPDYQQNGCRFLAPLWDWTEENVDMGLELYGESRPKLDTGSISMCLNCLCGSGKVFCPQKGSRIDAIDWDPVAMKRAFQEKHGYAV